MAALHFVGGWATPPATVHVLLQRRRPSKSSLSHFPFQRASSRMRMGLKLVQTFDSSFQLKPECEETLHSLLSSTAFRNQVATSQQPETNAMANGFEIEFTGELFQPVPWSVTTPHGMPQEFEKYFNNPEFVIVNVPPNFMFQAKIFNPSRLCAIFQKIAKEHADVKVSENESSKQS